MSNELLNNNSVNTGVNAGGDYPKASIGNYKGVMLCNRPNEFGQQRPAERNGLEPFNSRVDPKVPIGWNPTLKFKQKINKKKRDPTSILIRHRKFLAQLAQNKIQEREDALVNEHVQQMKIEKFRQTTGAERFMITHPHEYQEAVAAQDIGVAADQPSEVKSEKKSVVASSKHKKSGAAQQKPAWAMTEKQTEDVKEEEIDNLLEFAYELDYEKYMEDFEVRQAVNVIKSRVQELTKGDDWKAQLANEWNAADQANQQPLESVARSVQEFSQVGSKPAASQASKASKAQFSSRVNEQKAKELEERPEWNASTTSEQRKQTTEDLIANQIANEVLKENAKLKNVHSKESIKKILEQEAKRQIKMANGSSN